MRGLEPAFGLFVEHEVPDIDAGVEKRSLLFISSTRKASPFLPTTIQGSATRAGAVFDIRSGRRSLEFFYTGMISQV